MKTFKEFVNNIENPTQQGKDEDPRLVKIRQFKGNIEDLKSFINDKIKKS